MIGALAKSYVCCTLLFSVADSCTPTIIWSWQKTKFVTWNPQLFTVCDKVISVVSALLLCRVRHWSLGCELFTSMF
jgi:hypothetical protein